MAVGDAHVFSGFLTPVLTRISFQSYRLLFSHASAEVRGGNTPERNFDSYEDRTHNHQIMSPTRSPLSHPGGAGPFRIAHMSVVRRPQFFQTFSPRMLGQFGPGMFLGRCSLKVVHRILLNQKLWLTWQPNGIFYAILYKSFFFETAGKILK